ncbi:MAG: glycosyltransferase family 39 protein [bacterium]|nr:glycosyltransferase family 39 protein [bacterium]
MAHALRIAALPLLCLLPGLLLVRALDSRGRMPAGLGAAGRLAVAVLASVAATSWIGLLLAQCALFSLGAVAAVLLAACLALLPAARRPPPRPAAPLSRAAALAAAILLAAAALLFSPPYEYVLGNWDPGTYVNTGVRLAREGRINYRDPVLAEIPADARPLFYYTHLIPQRYEGGVAVADGDRAVVSPHFYHLFTVWIALMAAIGGVGLALRANLLFGLLSLVAVYAACREVCGRRAALAAAVFLGASAAQIWAVRFPTAEIPAQFFLLAGLACLLRHEGEEHPLWAALAGVSFACALLAVFTAVTVLPLLLLVLFWRNWERWRRADRWLAVPLAAGVVHLALQNATVSRHYFERQVEVLRSNGITPLLLAAGAALFLAALVAARLFGRGLRGRIRSLAARPAARAAACAAIAALFAYAYWIRPAVAAGPDARNLRELGWFVYPVALGRLYVPLGLLLALAGAVGVIARPLDERRATFLLIALASAAAILHRKMVFPSYFWAVRRAVPIVLPSLFILMSCALASLAVPRRARSAVAAGLALLMLGCMLGRYAPPVMRPDYEGTTAFIAALAARLDPDGLHIVEGSGMASPLDNIHGLDVLQLSGQTPEKCRGVERVVGDLLDRGRRVYYVSRGGRPLSAVLDFAPLFELPLSTDSLEHSVGRYPSRRVPVRVTARVFRVGRLDAEPADAGGEGTIDIGEDAFGLLRGFHRPAMRWEREGGRRVRRWARWTAPDAELLIPSFGGRRDLAVTIRAAAGRNRPGLPVPVRVSVNGREAALLRVAGGMADHEFTVPAASLAPGAPRAALRIETPAWSPPGGEHPEGLGVFVERLLVAPKDGTPAPPGM